MTSEVSRRSCWWRMPKIFNRLLAEIQAGLQQNHEVTPVAQETGGLGLPQDEATPDGDAPPPLKKRRQSVRSGVDGRTTNLRDEEAIASTQTAPSFSLDEQLSSLGLSTRAYNALRRAGIRTLRGLLALTPEEILDIRCIGRKTLRDIDRVLEPRRDALARNAEERAGHPPAEESLEQLRLRESAYARLRRCGLHRVHQLTALSQEDLVAELGFGWQDVGEIASALARRGQSFAAGRATYPMGDEGLLRCAQQKAVPLDRIDVRRLVLPIEVYRSLRAARISTVAQLCEASRVVLRARVRGTGDVIDETVQRLNAYLSWLTEQESWDAETTGQGVSPVYQIELAATPLSGVLDELLACLKSDRDRTIVALRRGLADGEPRTLQDVGDGMRLTRERVRQVEAEAMRRLRRECRKGNPGLLLGYIRDTLDNAGGVASTRQISQATRRAARSTGVHLASAIRLFCTLHPEVRRVRRDVWALQSYPLDEVQRIFGVIFGTLRENHGFASHEQLFGALESSPVYGELGSRVTDECLLAYMGAHDAIDLMPEGHYVLAKRRPRQLYAIVQSLRRTGTPLHYTQIAEEANCLLPDGESISPRTAHALLGRLGDLFVRCGHGVFGLSEWGLHDDRSLAEAVYRVLAEAARPLHFERITDQVLRTWRVGRGSVYMALQSDERFYRLGNGFYWLRDLGREATDEGKSLRSFSDLYGGFLLEGQERLEAWAEHESVDARDEVEKIRRLGSGLFE